MENMFDLMDEEVEVKTFSTIFRKRDDLKFEDFNIFSFLLFVGYGQDKCSHIEY